MRSRANAVLLMTPKRYGVDRKFSRGGKDTDAFGPVDLMTAEGEGIDLPIGSVERYPPDRLRSVAKQQRSVFVGELCNVLDWVNRTDYIVRRHNTDQIKPLRQLIGYLRKMRPPAGIHLEGDNIC